MAIRLVIIGGGPAGNQAATHAARLGADVVLVERDVVGGAAHLWDCIPSKAMIATGGAMAFNRRSHGMGLTEADVTVDLDALKERIAAIESRLNRSIFGLLESQGVRMVQGSGRLAGPRLARRRVARATVGRRADEPLAGWRRPLLLRQPMPSVCRMAWMAISGM